MAYFVLARRWRPQGFDAVVGQPHVTRTLANQLKSGRIGHAFIFSGPRGVGKTTTARILAKALNCARGLSPEPCGECESCEAIAAGSAVDVVEIDGASTRGIDDIRNIQESVRYAPVSSRFKVFIIDEAHQITKDAFNALLKTLEEPPERVKFILATTESYKMPATIRSRCQHFDFRLVSTEVLMKTLEGIVRSEDLKLSQRSLRLIVQAGRGSVRDALSLMEQVLAFTGADAAEEDVASVLGVARMEVFNAFMEGILAQDVDLLLRTTERLLESGYDLYQIALSFLDYLRDLCVLAAVPMPGGLLDRAPDELPRLQAVAKRFDLDTLMRYFHLVQQASERMRLATYPRPVFEMLLVALSRVRSLQPVDELARRLADLESRLRDDGGPPREKLRSPEGAPSGGVQGQSPGRVRAEPEKPAQKPTPPPSAADKPGPAAAPAPTPDPSSARGESEARGAKPEDLMPKAGSQSLAPDFREAPGSSASSKELEPPPAAQAAPPAVEAPPPAVEAAPTISQPPLFHAFSDEPEREGLPEDTAKALPAAEGNRAVPLLVEPGRELDVLEKVCARLEAQNGTRLLINALRTAEVAKLGADTVLVLPEADVVNQRPFEEPQHKALAEAALAAELRLERVALRLERRAEVSVNLLARDAEERRKLEKRWTSMARSVEGVRLALEMFGGRIEYLEVEEEDGETSRIRVEEEPQPEGAGR